MSFTSLPSFAALIDRGGGLIYDEDRDITWMQNAWAAGGTMSRTQAMGWVDALDFGGFDDWRLPSTLNVDLSNPDFSCDQDNRDRLFLNLAPCAGGEMGHLVFDEGLDWERGAATDPDLAGKGAYGSLGLFDNVFGGGYWTSEDYLWTGQSYEDPLLGNEGDATARTPKDGFGWLYYFDGGILGPSSGYKTILRTGNNRAVWAVRDGDVSAAVPTPDGDLNGDGLVDTADVLLSTRILMGQLTPTQDQIYHGDVAPLVNGIPVPDGLFSLGDVLVIQRKSLGLISF
jgi:hypothetical protein